jgi:hypothetical protein
MLYNKSWFRFTILPLSTVVPRCITLEKTIHVDPADQTADYNKLPIVNIIPFTYRHLDNLDVEIIVKLCTPKDVLLIRVARCRQRNSVSREDRLPRKYRRRTFGTLKIKCR